MTLADLLPILAALPISIVVLCTAKIIVVVIALRGAEPDARPAILCAVAALFRLRSRAAESLPLLARSDERPIAAAGPAR